MGFWTKVKSTYKKVDTKLGGYLPGGETPTQVKASTSTSSPAPTSSTPTSSPAPTSSTPTSSGGSSGGGFTGKVSEISPTGEIVDTKYYYDNKQIGSISGGTDPTYTPTTQNTYNLGFTQGTIQKNVTLTPKEASVTTGQIQAQESYSSPSQFTLDRTPIETGLHSVPLNDSFGGQTVYTGRETKQSYGVPVITQQEATKYGINATTSPVWILSTKDKDKGIDEAMYAGQIPYTVRATQTKDLQISNIANIRTGQELYKRGRAGETDINIDSAYAGGVKQAKIDYSQKPRGERFKLYSAGFGQGIAAVAINTAEFGGAIGLTVVSGKTMKVQVGGVGGEISNYPIAKGTYLGSPAVHATAGTLLIGGAGLASRSKKVGTVTAVKEAASFFSPFKIKNKIYGGTITSKTKFVNVKSFKYTAPGDVPVTTRVYKGSSGNIGMVGFEKSIKIKGVTYGGGKVITKAPYTEIKAGGAVIESGIKTTIQPYKFKSTGGTGYSAQTGKYFNTKSLTEYPGGISRVVTGKGITTYKTPTKTNIYIDTKKGYYQTTGGITSGQDKLINKFVSGGAKAQYKIDIIDKGYIYSPTSKYKVTPRFAGRELDLNKLIGTPADKGYSSFRGSGGKTPFSQTFAKPSTTINAPQISTTILKTSTSSPTIVRPKIERGQTPDIKTVQINKVKSNILSSSVIVAPAVVTSSATNILNRGRSSVIPSMSTAFKPMIASKIIPSITQVPAITQIQTPVSKQTYKLGVPSTAPGFVPGVTPPSYVPTTPVPIVTVPPFLMGGFGVGIGRTIIKGGKRRTAFVPSFTALAYNIRGTYKKKGALSKSGIDFRPITPGFKFKTGLRTKIKLPKII